MQGHYENKHAFPLHACVIPREDAAKFYLSIEIHIPWKILIWHKVWVCLSIFTNFKYLDGYLRLNNISIHFQHWFHHTNWTSISNEQPLSILSPLATYTIILLCFCLYVFHINSIRKYTILWPFDSVMWIKPIKL